MLAHHAEYMGSQGSWGLVDRVPILSTEATQATSPISVKHSGLCNALTYAKQLSRDGLGQRHTHTLDIVRL